MGQALADDTHITLTIQQYAEMGGIAIEPAVAWPIILGEMGDEDDIERENDAVPDSFGRLESLPNETIRDVVMETVTEIPLTSGVIPVDLGGWIPTWVW